MIKVLQKILFACVMLVGLSVVGFAQKDDQKKPPKDPPVVNPGTKPPPPPPNDPPKKPRFSFALSNIGSAK